MCVCVRVFSGSVSWAGPVGLNLGSVLYVDMCGGDGGEVPAAKAAELVSRIKELLREPRFNPIPIEERGCSNTHTRDALKPNTCVVM